MKYCGVVASFNGVRDTSAQQLTCLGPNQLYRKVCVVIWGIC